MSNCDWHLPWPVGLKLPLNVRLHNIEQMKRPAPKPRVVGPWHSASVHEDDCCCPRCEWLGVNGFAR